jgi:hypothetical protein
MRLYQSGALLTGARNELIRRGGVPADGSRIVAAGPLGTLMAGQPEKVIMGLYSGGVQIIAGTDAGIGNCPHDAYIPGLEALATPAGPSPR